MKLLKYRFGKNEVIVNKSHANKPLRITLIKSRADFRELRQVHEITNLETARVELNIDGGILFPT